MTNESLIPIERIASRIYVIRGERVMLDSDLATLYGVTTGNLNKALKRNQRRFPADFVFRLSDGEHRALRFRIGRANRGRGGRRSPPYAFTEQGVAMLSSVLRGDRAADVNVVISNLLFAMASPRQCLRESTRSMKAECGVSKTAQALGLDYYRLKKRLEPVSARLLRSGSRSSTAPRTRPLSEGR